MEEQTEITQEDSWMPVKAVFYIFARRVADGEASKEEISYMNKIFDLTNACSDWELKINV